jgi:hypothetical protein
MGLRACDALHCAAAIELNEGQLVAITGGTPLLAAWQALGLNTLDPNGNGQGS